ncbi:MAG: c-type cytochrome [Candidatus Sulfotelmatobacter sp.]
MTVKLVSVNRPGINSRVAALLFAVGISCVVFAQEAQRTGGKIANQSVAIVARGKYIVEGVAVCSQCHTPRDSNGNLDRSHWLEGAALWLNPAQPADNWPLQAPRIAGNPPGTDAEMVNLLTTGIWRDGKTLRPPMPQFRMTEPDAEAVVAYLKSLEPGPH